MAKITLVIAVAVWTAGAAGAADAAGYCRPTSDGKDRIAKVGICPSGYFASGDCCEAFRAATKKAFPKVEGKACPAGSFASGSSSCVSFK